jgi:hypothetical protein
MNYSDSARITCIHGAAVCLGSTAVIMRTIETLHSFSYELVTHDPIDETDLLLL